MSYSYEFINRFDESFNKQKSDREMTFLQSLELIQLENITESTVVLDLGSNYGEVIRALSPTGCKIYAFEPHPVFYRMLTSNYGNLDNVVLSDSAAWISREKRKFYFKRSPDALNGGATLMPEKTNITNLDLCIDVQCIDISEMIKSLGTVDVLKIDVEGAEYEILDKIFTSGTHKNVKSIYFEDHERKMPSSRFRELKMKVIRNYSSINKELYWW
jgi:FkbM family methyltransferase